MNNDKKKNLYSILFVFLSILEMEVMINFPEQWIIVILIGCILLINVYLIISIGIKEKETELENEKKKVAELEEIIKSEKASYLLIKRNFIEIEDRFVKQEKMNLAFTNSIDVMDRNIQKGLHQMMEEEKKVARITIGRTKENAEALINSNEELNHKILVLEEQLQGIIEKLADLNTDSDETNKIDEEQYNHILTSVEQLKESISEKINESIENSKKELISSMEEYQKNIPVAPVSPSENMTFTPELEEPASVVELEEEPVSVVELEEEPASVVELEEEPASVVELEEEPASIVELEEEPASVVELEEEPASVVELEEEPASVVELEEEPASVVELGEEPEPIVELEEEPVSVVEIEQPIVSDPNKMMSPDDIAALLETVRGGVEPTPVIKPLEETIPEEKVEPEPLQEVEIKPEPIQEAEIQPEPEPVKVETNVAPDPNKIMTPEEIAALIANL